MQRPSARLAAAILLGLLVCAGGCSRHYDVVPISAAVAYQDPQLLARAFALPVAARFQGPESLIYQKSGSSCGPASLVNVARSLGDSAITQDDVFAGTSFHRFSALMGMTLDRLGELARERTHRKVTVLRDLTLAEFRAHLKQSNAPERRYILNFHRGPLFTRGTGHHSPIGGYLEKEDLVLVLDVNAAYKPWLVSSERLFAAMDTVDSDGGKKRGMLLIE